MYRTSIYAEGNNITKSDLYQNGSHIKKRFNLVNIAPNNLDIHNNYLRRRYIGKQNIRIQNISHKQTLSVQYIVNDKSLKKDKCTNALRNNGFAF